MRICTVLPTHNENENIATLIERLLTATTDTHMALVVDDASSDGTAHAVRALALQHNRGGHIRVVLIQRRDEKGLTSAIQCGIDAALNRYQAELVSWMDCDLSMPPEDVASLLTPLLQQIQLQGDYGEYCIDFLCRALRAGFRIAEIPYVCVPRAGGESKTGLNLLDYLVRGRKYLATIFRLYIHNP